MNTDTRPSRIWVRPALTSDRSGCDDESVSENTTNGAQVESMQAACKARRDPRPAAPSNVVDLFVAATAYYVDPSQAEALHRQRERYGGGYSERDLVGRLLTAAARAMRRAVDQASPPAAIASGTEAFDELQAVRGAGRSRRALRRSGLRGLRLERARQRGQLELVEALEVASDRLGPLPAGGLAHVKPPDAAPPLERVDPTPDELAGMAAHAGAALGHLASSRSDIDPVVELREALEGP